MNFDYLQDCIDSTVYTYEKMLGSVPVTVGERYSQTGIISVHDVTALIGFNGDGLGSLLISMPQEKRHENGFKVSLYRADRSR